MILIGPPITYDIYPYLYIHKTIKKKIRCSAYQMLNLKQKQKHKMPGNKHKHKYPLDELQFI